MPSLLALIRTRPVRAAGYVTTASSCPSRDYIRNTTSEDCPSSVGPLDENASTWSRCSTTSGDGKTTALPTLNHPLVQNHIDGQVVPFGLVRTVTCSLVSAAGRPCINAIPIPAGTNEVAWFRTAFRSLVETYSGLFDVVTYDARGFSRANADAVVAAGKHYLFALKDEHRTMCRLAVELLAVENVLARTEDVLDNNTTVVRSLRLLRADPSWSYGDGKTPEELVWPHAKAFLAVEYVKVQRGVVVERDERMFVSSYDPTRLTPAQWLLLVGATGASRAAITPSTPPSPRMTGRGSRPTPTACSRSSCSAGSRTRCSRSSARPRGPTTAAPSAGARSSHGSATCSSPPLRTSSQDLARSPPPH